MAVASHPGRDARVRERAWIALVGAAFALTLAASWQRWADPVVDVGREMNQPLRLAAGEMLYSDVRHIYGPLSPWLHAALFRLFGPSLTILYIDGILCASLVVGLVYWLARRIMEPPAAAGATLNVIALCVFKPAGNYILPYSYSSLHGVTLGLVTLALLTRAVNHAFEPGSVEGRASAITRTFAVAGVTAGLATLAKTEMGLPALVAGLVAAALISGRDARPGWGPAVAFVSIAGTLITAAYALMVARAGWTAVATDSWLLLYNMPPEIAFFNGQVSGLADPIHSLGRMSIALAKLGLYAGFIAGVSSLIVVFRSRRAGRADTGPSHRGSPPLRPGRLFGGLILVAALMSVTTGLDRDKGPFLAMPFLLVALIVSLTASMRREPSRRTATLLVFAVYALAALARMVLHVRSGGAYASFLLPVSVVLLTYLLVDPFVAWLRDARVAQVARTAVITLIVAAGAINAAALAYRSRTRITTPIPSGRGTIMAEPDIGLAFNEALGYIERHTTANDRIAVLPEGTALTFLSGRLNPLREEIVTPGYLEGAAETRAIRQLQEARTALILVPNRPTREFGPAVFGRDYNQRLMRWIEANYTVCAMFGPVKNPALQIGDTSYFIRAYCPAARD